MEPQDNKAWNKAWGEAFDGARWEPSDAAWSAIEAEIAPQKPSYRAFWWVAASFLAGVASTAGVFLWWNSHSEQSQALSHQQEQNIGKKEEEALALRDNKAKKVRDKRKPEAISEEAFNALAQADKETKAGNSVPVVTNAESNFTAMVEQPSRESGSHLLAEMENTSASLSQELPYLRYQEPSLAFIEEVRWNLFQDRPIQWYEDELLLAEEEEESTETQPWRMGLALSSGALNGGIAGASDMEYAFDPAGASSYGFVDSEEKGITTSYGAQVGKRVGKRWVLSGGLAYSVSSHKSSSNLVLVDQGTFGKLNAVNEFVDTDAQQARYGLDVYQLEVSADVYQLKNQYEFISVPIQVGYYLVDTKWKVAVNTGLMADIFYKYTTTEESGALQDLVLRPKDSPEWNWLNTSLSTGMEVSREIGDNYLISVQPGYRLVLNKEGAFATNSLSPNVFQLGFSFQYIFQ